MTRPMSEEREKLAAKLRVTTEQMAHRCSVDQVLWNMHSNACLEAAALLLSTSSAERGMREALEFYADDKRYWGPNQNNPGNDPHTPEDAPYLTDVTRDRGDRARAALSPKGGG